MNPDPNIKVETFVASGIPIISGQHLHKTRLDESSGYNFITEEHAVRLKNSLVGPEDIIFTHAGTIGQVSRIPADAAFSQYVISQRQFYLRLNRTLADPMFVTYWFHGPVGRHRLLMHASQVGVPSISRPATNLRNIEIELPPLTEQRAIAATLGALDDKIELNRKMNATLEAMARALFRDWFKDFRPTRAKMEGRAPYLSPDLWSLFPDRLDSDDKPEGWEVSTIGDEVRVVGGSTPSTKEPAFWDGGINWATPKDLSTLAAPVLLETARTITEGGLGKISSGLLPSGTVLLSSRAPIGYLAISEVPVAVNQGFIAMTCDKRLSNVFVWLWTQESMEAIKANANGSTFQEISKRNFRPLPVIVPPTPMLQTFDAIIRPLHARIAQNEHESRTLAQTRDLLLPRLISGELRVAGAETLASEVA